MNCFPRICFPQSSKAFVQSFLFHILPNQQPSPDSIAMTPNDQAAASLSSQILLLPLLSSQLVSKALDIPIFPKPSRQSLIAERSYQVFLKVGVLPHLRWTVTLWKSVTSSFSPRYLALSMKRHSAYCMPRKVFSLTLCSPAP